MNAPRTFSPAGPLALEPRAFGMFLLMPYQPVTVERDGVTVLSIRGPISPFADPFCESYESIVARVEGAVMASSRPRAVVLSIASPGGVVAGCFEAAASIRSICARAGVPLLSHVDGMACSAAYALACAGSHIAASPTSSVGSIGVIAEVIDATARNAQQGLAVRMLASGAHKTDGQQAVQASGSALQSMQGIVDRLAGEFFAFVAQSRGVNADAVRALEAGIFIGADAQSMNLTDSTQTLDELLANIGSLTTVAGPATPPQAAIAAEGSTTMSKAYDEAIAALRKAAESDDPKESAKAKRMLKAELAEDDAPPADEPDGDEAPPAPPKKEDAAAPPVPKDEEDAKAVTARLAKLEASQAAQVKAQADAAVATERAQLLASRTDLPAELVATLAKATTAIETVRDVVKTLPRGIVRKPAAAAMVQGTRGEGQVSTETPSNLPPDEAHALDVQMGLASGRAGIRTEGTKQILGVMTRAEARAEIKRREGQLPTQR